MTFPGKRSALAAFLALATALVVAAVLWQKFPRPAHTPDRITIAVPNHLAAAPVYVAFTQGFFRNNGLEVTLDKHSSGKLCLDALLKGKADIAMMAELPIVNAALGNRRFHVFASTTSTAGHLGVGARKEREISRPEDLAGKRIGVASGTNHVYFLYTFLLENRVDPDRVTTVDLKPEQMAGALKRGDVDAVCTTRQILLKIQKESPDAVELFFTTAFIETFSVAGSEELVRNRPDTIKQVLGSLLTAADFIESHPEDSKGILAASLGVDRSAIGELWDHYTFDISLKQSLLLSLEEQARWATRYKLTDKGKVPNFLDYIHLDAMTAVRPDAVSVIH